MTATENTTDLAPLCLTFGWAAGGNVCCDCGEYIDVPAFVMVGRLDAGRLCDLCAELTPFGLVAEALDRLDTAVFMAHDRGEPAALMAMNVQLAVNDLVEREWLPRYAAELPDGAA